MITTGAFYSKASPEPSALVRHFLTWNFMAERNLFDGRLILRFKDEINLSSDQETKIENLMLSFEEHTITKGAEIKVKEIRLTTYIKSEKINRREIEKILREISQMKINFSISYINYLLDIRDILTSPQIEIIQEIKSKIKKMLRKKNIHQSRNR
jgi:Spy/CpxP family protein refolding chaperone